MRRFKLVLGVFVGSIAVACDAKEEPTPANLEVDAEVEAKMTPGVDAPASDRAAASAKALVDSEHVVEIEPRIGGTVILIDAFAVELIAFRDGRIEALVMDTGGELVADVSTLQVSTSMTIAGDGRLDIPLSWDASLARFMGSVSGEVVLLPGPVEVRIDAGGQVYKHLIAEVGLAASAQHGGQVMMAGTHSLELVAQAGHVYAYAFDIAGQAHTAGDLELQLELESGLHTKLEWDPPTARYQAKLDSALEFEGKPVTVRVGTDAGTALGAVHAFHGGAAVAASRHALDQDVAIRPPSFAASIDGTVRAKKAKAHTKVKSKGGATPKAKASFNAGSGIKSGFGGGKASVKAGFKIGNDTSK